MKKPIVISLIFFVATLMLANVTAQAQESFDKVTMLNGEEHIGQVVAMNDQSIEFVHKNESLKYSYSKADINKIQFASGRIEILNKAQTASASGADVSLQDHHNKVAVLPFTYMSSDGAHDDQMEKKVQSDCYTLMTKFASEFNLQDPTTTNATLIKHSINSSNIDGFTPAELCNILGVEYVVMGTVNVRYTSTTNYSGSSKTSEQKNDKKRTYTSTSSSSTDNFQTQVDMKMYSDQGQNIYANAHTSFWMTEDAYTVTLQWLIKRSPLYRK
ncbi:hypothetical protein [uncultured Draconibacterium sp.]|uniref:hypothetical protein n=1 Tax=uncultured Draconibacterium sp. TaxID=1573823 RepID=UPI0025DA9620|nr:hypothetical protein [uncultured Draconibacterium sp.]